ncbi:MAG TPA: hypothetical protein VMW29_02300 [Candidatus Bathyarchaeia archaeon]|nr:hypothetical protein [Candidatus Bathyarchaeia archaeon]
MSFVLFGLLFFLLLNLCWPKKEIDKAKLGASRWPLSVEKHLALSRTFFQNGNEPKALEELTLAKRLYQPLKFFDFTDKLKKQLEETEKLVFSRQKTKEEIEHWKAILQSKPSSRDIFLQLALLHYQLLDEERTKEYWQKAFYLDPNSEIVLKIGQLVSQ